ncbi:hypothetical protein ABZT48_46630, partial [Streptomyces avermitilis]|uniref:hypothetical protein n=1 Tax=Streptomyces avermitilis TaxID=33903 RepID=UPI00339E60BC
MPTGQADGAARQQQQEDDPDTGYPCRGRRRSAQGRHASAMPVPLPLYEEFVDRTAALMETVR